MFVNAKTREYANKFKRGQIWVLYKPKNEELKKQNDPNYYLLAKTRPWVIISDPNSGNHLKITAVPLTHTLKEYEYRVRIQLDRDEESDIVCDEPQTINITDFNKATYVATLNEETMNAVSTALGDYLSTINQTPLVEIETVIDNIIKNKAEEILGNSRQDFLTDSIALDIASKIEDLFNKIESNETIETIVPENNGVEIIKSALYEEEVKPEISIEKKRRALKKKRSRRSPYAPNALSLTETSYEDKVKFLKFLDQHGVEATSKEYNYAKSTLSKFKRGFWKDVMSKASETPVEDIKDETITEETKEELV